MGLPQAGDLYIHIYGPDVFCCSLTAMLVHLHGQCLCRVCSADECVWSFYKGDFLGGMYTVGRMKA